MLGSFWPNSRTSFESHVVKGFKNSHPTPDFEPGISHLCTFYTKLILNAVGNQHFDWIVRVLSSSEMQADPNRPQSLLVNMITNSIGAKDLTHLFFKSCTRPSMRYVKNLSGPDAFKPRIHYVLQDLFIRPAKAGGRLLLIDDIYNTGASTQVYARALKELSGVEEVVSVNLAATRFKGGKDGHGLLKLDISELENNYLDLQRVWVDTEHVFHQSPDCPAVASPLTPQMQFIAQKEARACSNCFEVKQQAKPWWKLW